MSYDVNVYIGWYAELTYKTEKVQDGETIKRVCSQDEKHKTDVKGKFCSVCGSKIIDQASPTYSSYPVKPHFLNNETLQEEFQEMTLHRGTYEDTYTFHRGYAVFPEFMRSGVPTIIMAPGYVKLDLDSRYGSVDALQVEPDTELSLEIDLWLETIKRLYQPISIVVKYGAVTELK
jgi:hypothetical protein